VIAASNHADILYLALMGSGHLDWKTDFSHPSKDLAGILLWPLKTIVALATYFFGGLYEFHRTTLFQEMRRMVAVSPARKVWGTMTRMMARGGRRTWCTCVSRV
jgi:hypothetical protein